MMVGGEFFNELILSVYDNLNTVDRQLELINNKLSITESSKSTEMKELLAKLTQDYLNGTLIKSVMGDVSADIDNRHIYYLLIQLEFQRKLGKRFHQHFADYLKRLLEASNGEVEKFNFEYKNSHEADPIVIRLSSVISRMAMNGDLSCLFVVKLYMMLNKKIDETSEAVEELSKYILRDFDLYEINDDEDPDEDVEQVYLGAIKFAIISVFEKKRSLDLFCNNGIIAHIKQNVIEHCRYLRKNSALTKIEIEQYGREVCIFTLAEMLTYHILSLTENSSEYKYSFVYDEKKHSKELIAKCSSLEVCYVGEMMSITGLLIDDDDFNADAMEVC